MTTRLLAFSLAAMLSATAKAALPADTTAEKRIENYVKLLQGKRSKGDTIVFTADTVVISKYEKRVGKRLRRWARLAPTQIVAQYAGNMGLVSAGIGWSYGKRRQWETHLLFGYLPKYHSQSAKGTMTLKENFIPWRLRLGALWELEPLSCGLYLNTVFGSDFWGRQPKRYPDKYYEFLSTRLRANIFVGQRISIVAPKDRRKWVKGITAFYEISTCDLYIRSMIQDKGVGLWDIIGLSLGVKLQLF